MIATEIDPTSVTTAAENIHKNQLNHLITGIYNFFCLFSQFLRFIFNKLINLLITYN